METVDEVIRDHAFDFIDKAVAEDKPFFCYLNPTRMHVVTHLSEKYEKLRTRNGWTIYRAGMAQLDDIVSDVMKKRSLNIETTPSSRSPTDNGAENFYLAGRWPNSVRRR
jgi:arylsulfatase